MNPVLLTLMVMALVAASPPATSREVLATAASTLFEGTPFILAAWAIRSFSRRPSSGLLQLLGCGCAGGRAARSLPAAIAAALALGPLVGAARFCAAWLLPEPRQPEFDAHGSPLDDLARLAPVALTAAVALRAAAGSPLGHLPPWMQLAGGAGLGFLAAPCGLGAVAIAVALHARTPLAAYAYCAIAGILDLGSLWPRHRHGTRGHDALAYGLLACGAFAVALRRGAELVHPLIAGALAAAAVGSVILALRHARSHNARARIAPLVMLAAAFVGAPPPEYLATETTASDAFPGERVIFTGQLVRDARASALVRYAITCCRADAAPIVIRLAIAAAYPQRTWLIADGTIERVGNELRLATRTLRRIDPPSDPFVYR